jgi:hypothetical protein
MSKAVSVPEPPVVTLLCFPVETMATPDSVSSELFGLSSGNFLVLCISALFKGLHRLQGRAIQK